MRWITGLLHRWKGRFFKSKGSHVRTLSFWNKLFKEVTLFTNVWFEVSSHYRAIVYSKCQYLLIILFSLILFLRVFVKFHSNSILEPFLWICSVLLPYNHLLMILLNIKEMQSVFADSSEQIITARLNCEEGVALNTWRLWSDLLLRYIWETVGLMKTIVSTFPPTSFILTPSKLISVLILPFIVKLS